MNLADEQLLLRVCPSNARKKSTGYPNGDSQLAKMCLGFCADTFGVEREKALFYINDVKVLDVRMRLMSQKFPLRDCSFVIDIKYYVCIL